MNPDLPKKNMHCIIPFFKNSGKFKIIYNDIKLFSLNRACQIHYTGETTKLFRVMQMFITLIVVMFSLM